MAQSLWRRGELNSIIMKSFCLSLFIILSISIQAQEDSFVEVLEWKEIIEDREKKEVRIPVPLTKEALQGAWKRMDIVYTNPMIVHDEADHKEVHEEHCHLWFEGNEVYEFEYPIILESIFEYEINGDALVRTKTKYQRNDNPAPLPPFAKYSECQSNLYKMEGSDEIYLCFEGYKYYRDTLDVGTINKLKSGKFNPNCLSGRWILVRGYDTGYDGRGFIFYDYPWDLSDTLEISKSGVDRFWGGGHFYLKVNGEKKSFSIEEIHIDSGVLTLYPEDWHVEKEWKEEEYDAGIHPTSRVRFVLENTPAHWRYEYETQ